MENTIDQFWDCSSTLPLFLNAQEILLEVQAISSYVQWLLLLFGAIFTQDAHLILVQQQVAISS